MRTTSVEHLAELQRNPKNIRNLCILAHVDHGKTTLADALVASNGIISSRLAGKLRYMDSREDEQIRGITMKSSAIALHYTKEDQEYLINLIDSPGHVDFSSEVSTAVRLCDGALVVVDVVEGVSPQTHVVLRQAWLENIHPCLVLNKIDRLITELKYSPLEAHIHLQQILEQVNAITGTLFSSDVMEKSSTKPVTKETREILENEAAVSIEEWSSGLEETDDSSLYFSPDLGNVVFASAIDGWGFSISDFVALYSQKLGIKPEILQKTLWGDYYLDSKTKRIFKKAQSKGKKPLFVQFILQNIWAVYEAVVIRRDKIKSEQIANSLKLKVSARDSCHTDPRVHLHSICSQWLPLSAALLSMVVEKLPSPLEISSDRVEKLMCSGIRTFESLPPDTKHLKQDFLACHSSEEAPVIVFISKMFAVDDHTLPKFKRRPLTQEEIAQRREAARLRHAQMMGDATPTTGNPAQGDTTISTETPVVDATRERENKTHFMAFARVYSGTIRKGQPLYVLGPRHDPWDIISEQITSLEEAKHDSTADKRNEGLQAARSVDYGTDLHVVKFTVSDLYLLMGRELESLSSVPAGNVLGIGGLQGCVLKSATISSTVACPPFTALSLAARPIVRVAIEPVHASDMPALARGMRLLNQADPCVETLVQETGEHVIVAAGEVHLQRCVDDLKEQFACVKLNVSDPIIPFRETVVLPPTVDMVNEAITGDSTIQVTNLEAQENNKNKLVEIKTANKQCTIYIRATPLPDKVVQLLDKSAILIKLLLVANSSTTGSDKKQPLMENTSNVGSEKDTFQPRNSKLQIKSSTRQQLREFYNELRDALTEAGDEWRDAVDHIWSFGPRRNGPNILLNRIHDYQRPSLWQSVLGSDTKQPNSKYVNYDNSIISGFQMAVLSGPLCAEPMMGICFIIENLLMNTGQTGMTGLSMEKTGHCGTSGHFTEKDDRTKTAFSLMDETASPEGKFDPGTKKGANINGLVSEVAKQHEPSDSKTNATGSRELRPLRDGMCSDASDIVVDASLLPNPFNEVMSSWCEESKLKEKDTELDPNMRKSEKTDRWGPFSGQLMSAVKEGCRRAFQFQPMRLMAAMYTCHIQATADVLGRMYAVIAKREGRVLSEEMKEGSDIFDVEAVIPVAESFGFAEEIRKRTSGVANPQLVFSHWEVIDMDPYWVPTTEEEYTHFGEKADSENQARKYMNSVRRRKGLYVEEKTVEHAEKQRTLKK